MVLTLLAILAMLVKLSLIFGALVASVMCAYALLFPSHSPAWMFSVSLIGVLTSTPVAGVVGIVGSAFGGRVLADLFGNIVLIILPVALLVVAHLGYRLYRSKMRSESV